MLEDYDDSGIEVLACPVGLGSDVQVHMPLISAWTAAQRGEQGVENGRKTA